MYANTSLKKKVFQSNCFLYVEIYFKQRSYAISPAPSHNLYAMHSVINIETCILKTGER